MILLIGPWVWINRMKYEIETKTSSKVATTEQQLRGLDSSIIIHIMMPKMYSAKSIELTPAQRDAIVMANQHNHAAMRSYGKRHTSDS